MNAPVMPRRLLVPVLIAVLALASLPSGAVPLGGGDETTLSCTMVQRVVSARTTQLTERGESHLAAWPAHDVPRTDVQMAQHPRPHFERAALPLQSLLSVYRI
jgi:hypothetical protein